MKRMLPVTVALLFAWSPAFGADGAKPVVKPIDQRFAAADADEVPSFRAHIVPLMGKLGCNGRACHGSFQGQGGFRLSLFGYDFKMDHEGLVGGDEPRADVEFSKASLMLEKPTLTIPHKGGKRMEDDGWEYRVFLRWIEGGAKGVEASDADFARIEVTPKEIIFNEAGQTTQLNVIAVWSDGTREDVTPLCRFQTNSEQVAAISEGGLVTAAEPGDTHVVVFYDNGVVPIPVLRPVSDLIGPNYPEVPAPTKIDELVVQKLRKLGVVPSELGSDAEFLRRVSLDMTGSLPSPSEVEAFLADQSSDKRARKIDELLERPTYAAWWTTRLCDITGNNDDALNNTSPDRNRVTQDWYDWIYRRVADNVPYDDLIAGIVLGSGRERGQSYTDYAKEMSDIYRPKSDKSFADRETMQYFWARRTIRQPSEKALSFAYTFLGIRIQCAECHKHPFDQWTQDDYNQFTKFFTRVSFGVNPDSRRDQTALLKELNLADKRGNELRRDLPRLIREGKTVPFDEVYVAGPRGNSNNRGRRNRNNDAAGDAGKLLGGAVVELDKYKDPREALMQWLRDKENPFFARAFVNRVWAGYFNVGIVEPPDDHSLANPPSNAALLDYLTEGFIANGFDMKWLHREIANSRTYQLSWQPNETNTLDEANFSRAVPRRLPAEVAYDAIRQATASDSLIAKMQEDVSDRAIAIPGAGRRRGQAGPSYALTIFGKSPRENNCDCERSSEPSLLQTVYLRNDQDLLSQIESNRDSWLAELSRGDSGRNRDERSRSRGDDTKSEASTAVSLADAASVVRQAYLRTLSRYPDETELARARQYLESSEDPVSGLKGLLWALLNTKEFIVNH